jgi:putative ABC transport system permease protein
MAEDKSLIAYRCLLRLFPPSFRERFAGDLSDVFADRLTEARARGRLAVSVLWMRTAHDLIRHGLAERRAVLLSRDVDARPERTRMWVSLRQDVRYAARTLRRRPGFTVVAVTTLTLGIGATTAVFSVADALLFRSLPYPAGDRLVTVEETNARLGFGGNVAMPNFDDWSTSTPSIELAAAWTTADVNLATGGEAAVSGAGQAERVRGALVTPNFFVLVGAQPIVGRGLREDEREAGRERVVLLGERAWRRLYAQATDVVGRMATLDGVPHEIIGVVTAAPAFEEIDLYRPLAKVGPAVSRRNHAYRGVARLAPAASIETATRELDTIFARLETAYPDTNRGWRLRLTPLKSTLTEDLDATVMLMGAVVATLLLIGCSNIASLLVSRARDRRREFGVRTALGASRPRLVRQVVTECIVLWLAGALAGMVLASWGIGAIVQLLGDGQTLWNTPRLDWRVVAFSMVLSATTGLLFGLLPAFTFSRWHPQDVMRGSGTSTISRTGRRMRTSLTFVQIALALVLLVCASLLVSSLTRVLRIDPGFRAHDVVTFRVTPPRATYADATAVAGYYESLLGRLRALPGVSAIGAVSGLPLAGNSTVRGVIRPGDPIPEPDKVRLALYQVSTPGYFTAIGMRLLRGRDFTNADTATSMPVAIINESMAAALWPGADALGREILVHTDEQLPRTVVGVFADVHHYGLDRRVDSHYFVPLTQAPSRTMSLALRLSQPVAPAELRRATSVVDPALPIYDVRTVDDILQRSVSGRKALAMTLTLFGALALVLASVGLYGTIAAGVAERRREIGIRLSLGASQPRVLRLFLRQGMIVAAAATIVGLGVTYWVTPLVRQFLFEITPLDSPSFAAAAAVVLAVAFIATWIPARQAVRIDPVETLRAE